MGKILKFEKVFVEQQIESHPRTQEILSRLKDPPTKSIRKIEDYFGRVKKPYLHKRDSMNLYLGRKEGKLVKKTPDAYGFSSNPHYYFIYNYNCIFECQYCYLQGYFDSPDIVFFVNHEEIADEIERITVEDHPSEKEVWFHAGEYSDSLALSGLTNEWEVYWDVFEKNPRAHLELRTKSVNIRPILELPVLKNVIPTFSLSPSRQSREIDLKTPPLEARLKAISKLVKRGYKIGIHFDPIIYSPKVLEEYFDLVRAMRDVLPPKKLRYLSLGVVRFTKDVYRQAQANYPKSEMHSSEFTTSFDGKVRYPRPIRLKLMNEIKDMLMQQGYNEEKIYLCME